MDDLAVQNGERAVARHAGDDGPQLMYPARVPEPRNENAFLHASDELLAGLVACLEAHVHRSRQTDERLRVPGVLGLVPVRRDRVVHNGARDTLLDEAHAVARLPFEIERPW